MRCFFLCLIVFTFLNCGDDKTSLDVVNATSESQKIGITTEAIESFDYKDYVLSTEGEKAVMNWEKYQELAIQINYLKKIDLSFFNGENEDLKKFTDEFKLGLPKLLNTNPISSRMSVVETTVLRLNDNLTMDNISDKDKLKSIKEVLVAFSNLNYQINKKLIRDKFDKISSEY